ncbi:MAG: polar localization protein TipN [Phenylobacterium sp.]|uniref:polar localization protein TipN n=1 Tax=Phenylobacterium sp. TaxID=1871053 RepID=UPI00271F9A17|nr:polar localization protein TipN [Phenylobacterium sp.]MDO8408952.1 polar localization protein TipN [Phenylobacterium sp.]
MKIKNRRHQPLDFQSLTEPDSAARPESDAPDAGPDHDLDLTAAPEESEDYGAPETPAYQDAPISSAQSFGAQAYEAPVPGAEADAADAELFEPATSRPQDASTEEPFRLADPAASGDLTRTGARTSLSSAGGGALTASRGAEAGSGEMPPAWPIYAGAAAISALWSLAPIAYAWGYRGDVVPFQNDAFALAVFALLALAPAVLVWVVAYALRQGQKLALEARRTQRLADELVSPAMVAAGRAGEVVQNVREEIVRAGEAAHDARETLSALRAALAAETEQLVNAAQASARTAENLTRALSHERSEMTILAGRLDAQSTAVMDAITSQARMVAEASDLAETQLREAEASLAARAADLAAAAGETSDVARIVGEDLTRHIARLESAGAGVADQVGAAEVGLSEQRAALVAVAHGLRADQESFAAEAETHTAKLAEYLSEARLSAVEMGDRAIKGAQMLRELVAQAADQFGDLADAAQGERDAFGESIRQSWRSLSETASGERSQLEAQTRQAIAALSDAAEETRLAAARHAEAARQQVDQLSEAAFAAGQKADQVFEGRLEEARALIEQSASLVDEAGAQTARKLEAGAAAARQTLNELQTLMADLDTRAADIPASARRQAQDVRQAVGESIEDLMDQARRTAEETQAIDAAFQERVSRNYEMLSEAVRLMGSVASSASAGLAPGAGLGSGLPPVRERRPFVREERPRPSPRAEEPLELNEPAPRPGREPRRQTAEEAGLRPRLRLTPTATDEEFSNLFESAGGPPAPQGEGDDGDGLTWKDLLAAIDEPPPRPTDERREAQLLADIVDMGIDPSALLPRTRIEEIGAAVQTGDAEGARQVVRRLAPAATRRLTRRLFTDDALKGEASAYVRRYRGMLEETVARDHEGFMVATLLASDAGRVFLLLDAAAGDMM